MNWLNKLERKFGRYAIHNLTLYLIGGYIIGRKVNSASMDSASRSLSSAHTLPEDRCADHGTIYLREAGDGPPPPAQMLRSWNGSKMPNHGYLMRSLTSI